MMKLLRWTRGGFTIEHKGLMRGTFMVVKRIANDGGQVEIDAHAVDAAEVGWMLPGRSSETCPRCVQYRHWE